MFVTTASKPFCIRAAVSVSPRPCATAMTFVPVRSLLDLMY